MAVFGGTTPTYVSKYQTNASFSSDDNFIYLPDDVEGTVRIFSMDGKQMKSLGVTGKQIGIYDLPAGKYLVRSKILETNPAENVPMPKRPKRLVAVLGQKDLAPEKFPEIENPSLQQVRARILLELIYGSGLRISECQMLTWDHMGF